MTNANWEELARVREQYVRAGVDVTAKIPPSVLIDLLVDLNERLKKLEARE